MLDIHTHILPRMDDGSDDPKKSRVMLRREAKRGVGHVVLTPHFYADRETPERFLQRRAGALALLESEVSGKKQIPFRHAGAEVAFFRGISRMEEIERLCIDDTGAILIEMPFNRWSRQVFEEIHYLYAERGVRPIIAHVERYMSFQPLGTIGEMLEAGMWIQANTSFFLNWQTSWLAMYMLKNHKIQFVGSDCHDLKRRPPNVGEAIQLIERRLGTETLTYLEGMEQRLFSGI